MWGGKNVATSPGEPWQVLQDAQDARLAASALIKLDEVYPRLLMHFIDKGMPRIVMYCAFLCFTAFLRRHLSPCYTVPQWVKRRTRWNNKNTKLRKRMLRTSSVFLPSVSRPWPTECNLIMVQTHLLLPPSCKWKLEPTALSAALGWTQDIFVNCTFHCILRCESELLKRTSLLLSVCFLGSKGNRFRETDSGTENAILCHRAGSIYIYKIRFCHHDFKLLL